MARGKRKAVSSSDQAAKRRKLETDYSENASTQKELARREGLKTDGTKWLSDLNRRNRNVASSRAIKTLKASREYLLLPMEERYEAELAEKARVKAEYDKELEKQLADHYDVQDESQEAALERIGHWLVDKHEDLEECEGAEDGWEWDPQADEEEDGVESLESWEDNLRALIEKQTNWDFRLNAWNVVVKHWHEKIFKVLSKVKQLKSKAFVTESDTGALNLDINAFKCLLSRKQFKATIAKGIIPKPHQIFDAGERAIIRNILTWDEETLQGIPHWWPSRKAYDYERHGFDPQVNGFAYTESPHMAEFLYRICVELPQEYGSAYKPGVPGKVNVYDNQGWLFKMLWFEHGIDPKSAMLSKLSLSRTELRMRRWNEMMVWDSIKTADDLEKEMVGGSLQDARDPWDMRD